MIKRYETFQDWSAILEDYPMVGMKEDPEGDLVYYVDYVKVLSAMQQAFSVRLEDKNRYISDLENTCSDLEREVSQLERDLERSQEYFTNEESQRWR